MLGRTLTLSTLIGLLLTSPALGQNCESTLSVHAERILGKNSQGELTNKVFPEVAGDASFYQALENGWVFALIKAENGWSTRVYDSEPIGDAVDLTVLTPPRLGPNPRDIFGWHFRNQANTGANIGDVNAPQHQRAFVISPALIGTGGYRPIDNNSPIEPNPNDSIGWLKILDFGLAGLKPGEKARMNYLKFDACVTRKRSSKEQGKFHNATISEYTAEDTEIFGDCGLNMQQHVLNSRYLPRVLGGDLDGDGSLDQIAQIVDIDKKQHGLALCRAGTWLSVLEVNAHELTGLRQGYIEATEAWHWLSRSQAETEVWQGHLLPKSDGDIVILERIEKEAVAIYWRNNKLHSEHLYHHVEP